MTHSPSSPDSRYGLLPCPFCGAQARTDLLPHAQGPGWVQCSECECDQHMSDTLEEAVIRWNTRATQPAVPVGLEPLPTDKYAVDDPWCRPSPSSAGIRGVWSRANLIALMTAMSKAHLGLTEQELFGKIADAMMIYLTPPAQPSAGIESALRDAFPHFQDDAPITTEAIRGIGKEYLDMVMGWEPQKTEIEFSDHDGNIQKIVYEPGEFEADSYPGWVLDGEPAAPAQPSAGGETLIEKIIYENASISHFGNECEVDNAAFLAREILAALTRDPAQQEVSPGVVERLVTDAMETSRLEAIEECAKIAENNGWEATAAQIRDLAISSTEHDNG